MERNVKQKKRRVLIDKSFGKFIIVGAINTLFGTGIMLIFYNIFHFNYWISSAANYFFGSALSYILNKKFTCHYKGKSLCTVVRFIINILICYLIAYGIAKPLMSEMLASFDRKIQENGAMIFGMILFTILNYLGQRFFAFRHTK